MKQGNKSLLCDLEIFTIHHKLGTVTYQVLTKETSVSEIIEHVVKNEKSVLVDEHTANKLAVVMHPPNFLRYEYNDSLRHSFFILLNVDDITQGRLCQILNHDIITTRSSWIKLSFNVNKNIVTSYPINTIVLYDTCKKDDPFTTKLCKVNGYIENHDDKERPGILYLELVELPKLINGQVHNGGSYFVKHTDVIKMRNL